MCAKTHSYLCASFGVGALVFNGRRLENKGHEIVRPGEYVGGELDNSEFTSAEASAMVASSKEEGGAQPSL
jgi:hypothetical protein